MKLSRLNKLLILILVAILSFSFLSKPITPEDNEYTTCNVLFSYTPQPTIHGFGTGNFINNAQYPYVLTCKHVVKDAGLIGIKTINGEKTKIAKLVIQSKTLDYAILEIDVLPKEGVIAKYSDGNTKIGDKIYYWGLIKEMGPTLLHRGIISQKYFKGHDHMQVNVVQGSSGSTIFNENGFGIGIVCAGNVPEIATHCIYLRIDEIRKSLADLQIPQIAGILDGECNVRLSEISPKLIETP